MKIKYLKLKQIGVVCLLSLGSFLTPFTSIALAVQESPTPQLYSEAQGTLVAQTGSEMRETQHNIGNDVDLSQLNNRLDALEKAVPTLKKNKKDFWDKLNIVASFLIPISIAVVGLFYNNMESRREKRWKEAESRREERWKEAQSTREEQRTKFEQATALTNAQVKQAELISMFIRPLLSEDEREKTIAINAIMLGCPEQAEIFQKVIVAQSKQSQQVKNEVQESLKIVTLNNCVSNRYELYHLYRLYEAEKQNKPYNVKKRSSFLYELRHLRSLGLFENQNEQTLGGMPPPSKKVDLRDYIKLTEEGEQYIQDREKYGLYNPRRKGNPEFWDSLNQAT